MIDQMTHEQAEEKADEVLDDISDQWIRERMRVTKDRRDYAVVAANIAEDRYGAGSQAAICTVAIC